MMCPIMNQYSNRKQFRQCFLIIVSSFTDDKSFALSQPYSYSLVNLMDFTAKQKGDNKDGIKVREAMAYSF